MAHFSGYTPQKLNVAPEKWWLEDYFPCGKVTFQGLAVTLRGEVIDKFCWKKILGPQNNRCNFAPRPSNGPPQRPGRRDFEAIRRRQNGNWDNALKRRSRKGQPKTKNWQNNGSSNNNNNNNNMLYPSMQVTGVYIVSSFTTEMGWNTQRFVIEWWAPFWAHRWYRKPPCIQPPLLHSGEQVPICCHCSTDEGSVDRQSPISRPFHKALFILFLGMWGLWEGGWLRFPSFDAPKASKNTPPTCTPLYSNSPYLSLKLWRLVTARIIVGNPNPNLYWPLLLGWGCIQLGTMCNQVACWYCLKTSGWYIHHVSSWWVAYNQFMGQVPFAWCIIWLWWCLTQVHGNFHNPVSFLRKSHPPLFGSVQDSIFHGVRPPAPSPCAAMVLMQYQVVRISVKLLNNPQQPSSSKRTSVKVVYHATWSIWMQSDWQINIPYLWCSPLVVPSTVLSALHWL